MLISAAFDFDKLTDTITQLEQGKSVTIPKYDFMTSTRYVVFGIITFFYSYFFLFFLEKQEWFGCFDTANILFQFTPNQSLQHWYALFSRKGTMQLEPADVIIVEGILIFYDVRLRNKFAMKLFVDADADIRLARRGRKHRVFFVML